LAGFDFRDPRFLRLILGLVILAGLVFVYFNFIASGVEASISDLEDTLDEKQIQLRSFQGQTAEDMAMMAQQIERYQRELENLDRFLPRTYNQEEVMDMLTEKASASGLQILSLTPIAPTMQQDYNVYAWQVHMTGRYHRLGVFFDQLTQETMMTAIDGLEVQKLRAAEGKFDNIEATFTFSAFVQP